jgi:hypothetical protein
MVEIVEVFFGSSVYFTHQSKIHVVASEGFERNTFSKVQGDEEAMDIYPHIEPRLALKTLCCKVFDGSSGCKIFSLLVS